LDYLARAEKVLPDLLQWKIQVTATRGLLLVQSDDLDQGMPYVIEAVKMAQDHGNYRLLDHFRDLQSYLARKAIAYNQVDVQLGEALYGSLMN
jgi:hypothetical protein